VLALQLMGGWPTINQRDHLLLGKRGGSLPRRVTFGHLAFSKSSCGHVVLHHGAFLQLVSDRVHMIWASCFEMLFKVISSLPHLVLSVSIGGGDELLIRVTSILVVALIAAGGDHDSLWSPLGSRLFAFSTPPCTLVD
jgi:hypothetical protein